MHASTQTVVTTNLLLAVVFLVAGIVLYVISQADAGSGLIGVATGLAIGAGAPAAANKVLEPTPPPVADGH